MKQLVLVGSLWLLAAGQAALAASPAPTDTLAGHARLVRTISNSLCAQLTAPGAPDVSRMSSPAVMAYGQQLFIKAMQSDSASVIAMMTSAAERGMQPAQVGQQLGRDAMLDLTKSCPAARPLAVRLAQTEQAQQAMAAQMPALSPAERKVLQPIAAALCTDLNARNAKAPFAKLTPEGRQQVFMGALQKAFKPQTAALLRYYGSAKLDAQMRSGELDGKIGSLMPSQGSCGQYLVLIGADRLDGKIKKP